MKFLILTSIFLGFFLIFLQHPMSLGFILLMQTLIINFLNFNFWFSYILFLISVSGMLILFIYMTSIASNEKFLFSNKLLFLLMIWMMSMIMLLLVDSYLKMQFFFLMSQLFNLFYCYYLFTNYINRCSKNL